MESGSARGRLLGRGRVRRDERTGFAREGVWIESRACGGPELGSEPEIAVHGPIGHDANDVSEVGLGVEAVQFAGSDEQEEIGGSVSKSNGPF